VSERERVLIVGEGCVGAYLARQLARSGTGLEVVLAGRPGRVEPHPTVAGIVARYGLARVAGLERLEQRAFRFVVLATKTYHHEAVAADLARAGVTAELVVSLHNGLTRPPRTPWPAPMVRVITPGGYAFDPSLPDGLELHNEELPWKVDGDGERPRAVASFLSAHGQPCEPDPRFGYQLLRKFHINDCANLLTVIHDTDVAGLLDVPERVARMHRIFHETSAVLAETREVPELARVLDSVDLAALEDEVFRGIETYRAHFPSSHHDFHAGRPLELDALNGYVVAVAEAHGRQAPENAAVVRETLEALARRDAVESARRNAVPSRLR